MNNFIFKSANRLIKNSPTTMDDLMRIQMQIQAEQRAQRQDLKDISLKIQKLMIDKHLQMQVDEYFDNGSNNSAEPSTEDL